MTPVLDHLPGFPNFDSSCTATLSPTTKGGSGLEPLDSCSCLGYVSLHRLFLFDPLPVSILLVAETCVLVEGDDLVDGVQI